MRQYFLFLFVIFASPFVKAEWRMLVHGSTHQPEQYIDVEKVKQTGPMAIYRQVPVLSQGDGLDSNGDLSTLALYEYDCMKAKFRLLQLSGFSRRWAEGQVTAAAAPNGLTQWTPVHFESLEQQIFNLLCSDGKDQ